MVTQHSFGAMATLRTIGPEPAPPALWLWGSVLKAQEASLGMTPWGLHLALL